MNKFILAATLGLLLSIPPQPASSQQPPTPSPEGQPMQSQITYNEKVTLSAPPGGVLKSIAVTVELDPADAGLLIYGWLANGNLGQVEVRGAKSEIDLPFVQPEIFVKYLGNLRRYTISTRGFTLNH